MLGQSGWYISTLISLMQGQNRSADKPIERKVTAERDEAFVVFHIGMRINALWKVYRWLPILLVAPRIVRELSADPESGLLGSRTVVGPGIRNLGFIQYWESFEALETYARDGDGKHFPAWQEYYESGTSEDAALGIWHETYLVDPEESETVYNNMPAHGLAACDGSDVVPASDRRRTAADRMGRADGSEYPLDAEEKN